MDATICRIAYHKKYLEKCPDGGFRSVYPDVAKRYAIVKGTSVTIGWQFEDDGPVVTELYEKTEDGLVVKVDTEQIDATFFFKNRKACVTKYVHETRTDEGKILTDELVGPWLTEGGVTEFKKGIEIPDGTYPMEGGGIVVKDDCEIYQDSEHAAWYTEVTIDGKCDPCKAKLFDLGTDITDYKCLDMIKGTLENLKKYAKSNNIKLWYDTGSDTIRAVKVPNGYNCTMYDHEYKDQIPWELMPVVGELSASTDPDSDWQMGLVKIPEAKEGEHADR